MATASGRSRIAFTPARTQERSGTQSASSTITRSAAAACTPAFFSA
jgi:hypothetical protein